MYMTLTLTSVLGGADAVDHHLLLWGWHGGQGRYNKLSQSETGYIFVEQESDYCWALSIPNLYLKDFLQAVKIFQTKKCGLQILHKYQKHTYMLMYTCIYIYLGMTKFHKYQNTLRSCSSSPLYSIVMVITPNDPLFSMAAFRDTHTYFSMDTGSGVPCRRTVMTLEMVLMVAGVNWLSFRMWSNRPTIPRSRISWKLLLWSL